MTGSIGQPDLVVVALGGNTLVRPGQQGTIAEQAANLDASLAVIAELVARDNQVLVTHGNAPQVGHILLRVEAARDVAYDLPLDFCVAQSQGEMGYLIAERLTNLLVSRRIARGVVAVVTRTVVDRGDPHMTRPDKPVGPYYGRAQAAGLLKRGYEMLPADHKGFRRVVPSPRPVRVLEVEAVRGLLAGGAVVIAGGGGGVPVALDAEGQVSGVEAVVDKDLTTSLMAVALGAHRIVDLTAVECVKLWYDTPREQDLHAISLEEARRYLAEGHFAPGTMGPKIEAAVAFLEGGGEEVVITTPERASSALAGSGGTQIRGAG